VRPPGRTSLDLPHRPDLEADHEQQVQDDDDHDDVAAQGFEELFPVKHGVSLWV